MPQQSTVTKALSRAEQFRAKQRIPLTLPSGLEILAKRADITALLTGGFLPDTLTPIVQEMIARASKSLDTGAAQVRFTGAIMEDPMGTALKLYDGVLKLIGIDPVFVETVTDPETQVSVHEVDFLDKQFVFAWMQTGSTDLAAFRAKQERALAVASTGEELRAATE